MAVQYPDLVESITITATGAVDGSATTEGDTANCTSPPPHSSCDPPFDNNFNNQFIRITKSPESCMKMTFNSGAAAVAQGDTIEFYAAMSAVSTCDLYIYDTATGVRADYRLQISTDNTVGWKTFTLDADFPTKVVDLGSDSWAVRILPNDMGDRYRISEIRANISAPAGGATESFTGNAVTTAISDGQLDPKLALQGSIIGLGVSSGIVTKTTGGVIQTFVASAVCQVVTSGILSRTATLVAAAVVPAVASGMLTKTTSGVSGYEQTVLDLNPIVYWRLGETAGATIAVDTAGNNNSGEYKGSPLLEQTSVINDAGDSSILIDQTTNTGTVEATNSGIANPTGDFSSVLWFNRTFEDTANHQGICQKLSSWYVRIRATNAAFRFLRFTSAGVQSLEGNTVEDSGVDHMLTCTYSSANGMTMYMDDGSTGSFASNATFTAVTDQTTSLFTLGIAPGAVRTDAYLDEFSFFDYELTTGQIKSLWDAGTGEQAPGGEIQTFTGQSIGDSIAISNMSSLKGYTASCVALATSSASNDPRRLFIASSVTQAVTTASLTKTVAPSAFAGSGIIEVVSSGQPDIKYSLTAASVALGVSSGSINAKVAFSSVSVADSISVSTLTKLIGASTFSGSGAALSVSQGIMSSRKAFVSGSIARAVSSGSMNLTAIFVSTNIAMAVESALLTTPTVGILITQGGGWPSATTEPGPQGDSEDPWYTAKAAARWNVIPRESFTGDFEIGVTTFHQHGIQKVAIGADNDSADPADWTQITSEALNPRTNTYEWYGILDASTFNTGLTEIRAVAYPNTGQPRLLTANALRDGNGDNVLKLFANPDSQWTGEVRWCDGTGSDSAGDGSSGNPFRTFWKAFQDMPDAGGGVVNCFSGDYYSAGPSFPYPNQTNTWCTFRPAPGVPKEHVTITGAGGSGFRVQAGDRSMVKFEGMRVIPATTGDTLIFSARSATHDYYWLDDLHLSGRGDSVDLAWGAAISHQLNSNLVDMYVTDCKVENCKQGLLQSEIIKGSFFSGLGEDCFKNNAYVVNCAAHEFRNTIPGGHADFYQITNGSDTENVIVYNVTGTDVKQGLFLSDIGGITGCAFVNIAEINTGTSHNSELTFTDTIDNVLFWNITSMKQGGGNFRFTTPTETRFSVRGCVFDSNDVFDGTYASGNHFVIAANATGVDYTTGDPQFVDTGANDYHPAVGSPLLDRITPLFVDVDIENILRGDPAAVGAYEPAAVAAKSFVGSGITQAVSSGIQTRRATLSAGVAVIAVTTGSLTKIAASVNLAGSAVAQAIATGVQSKKVALTGPAIAETVAAGVQSRRITFSSSAIAASVVSGDLKQTKSISGTGIATSVSSADIKKGVQFISAVVTQVISSGNLRFTAALSSQIISTAVETSVLTRTLAPGLFSGSGLGLSVTAGYLTGITVFNANSVTRAISAAAITSRRSFAASTTTLTVAVAPQFSQVKSTSGSAIGRVVASATLSKSVKLLSAVVALSATSAKLSTRVEFASSSVSSAIASEPILQTSGVVTLASSVIALSTSSGLLSRTTKLSSSATAEAISSGAIVTVTTKPFSGSTVILAVSAGDQTKRTGFSANAITLAVSSASSTVSGVIPFTGAAVSTTVVSGPLGVSGRFIATAIATSISSGQISTNKSFFSHIVAPSISTGQYTRRRSLFAIPVSITVSTGNIEYGPLRLFSGSGATIAVISSDMLAKYTYTSMAISTTIDAATISKVSVLPSIGGKVSTRTKRRKGVFVDEVKDIAATDKVGKN